jgi:hypothetical protein
MILRLPVLTLCLCIGSFFVANAQPEKWIKGSVSDDWGVPIEHVFVYLANQKPHGTYTKADGSYALSITEATDTLICTHINYQQSFEVIKGNTFINFVLQRKAVKPTTLQVAASVASPAVVNPLPTKKAKAKKNETAPPQNLQRNVTKTATVASFKGGDAAYQNYLTNRIIITDSLAVTAFTGTLKISFFIGADGTAKNITLLKGVQHKVNNLVIAAIANMPAWLPATQNGTAVDEYKELEIDFNIKAKETVATAKM